MLRPKIFAIDCIKLAPRILSCKEGLFALPRLSPGDPVLNLKRAGLLDGEPIVLERLSLVADKSDPWILFALRDTVGLGEDAWTNCQWE